MWNKLGFPPYDREGWASNPNYARTDEARFADKVGKVLNEELKTIHNYYIRNCWAASAFIYGPHGWCDPTGKISYRDNIGKWPTVDGVYAEWKLLAEAFPYLDLKATLMNVEACEENAIPLVTFIVKDGKVKVTTSSKHHLSRNCLSGRDNRSKIHMAKFINYEWGRECGLPHEWFDEYAKIIKPIVKKVKLTDED